MGSKRQMLLNGLGEVLANEARTATRIVDLFSGSGSVSWFAASELGQRVLANDLQEYACVLARAVVERTTTFDVGRIERDWFRRVIRSRNRTRCWREACDLERNGSTIESWCARAREMCSLTDRNTRPIWTAYGGYYFSPKQAMTFDAMLRMLPAEPQIRTVCLAATIVSASCCAAAPGHTAQPFKANATAGKYLREAWLRDPLVYAQRTLEKLAGRYAKHAGSAVRSDANHLATGLGDGDLVFVDPPYSSVQYSRFYHVLETVAMGKCGPVRGTGRYPPKSERPTSFYSQQSAAAVEVRRLLRLLASSGCRAVVTFPAGPCSNGLSGEILEVEAREYFDVKKYEVRGRFSTLGGNTRNRAARQGIKELILVLRRR